MAIARFESINVNNLTFTKSDFGEGATVQALWFATRARVASVANTLKIADKYRLYQDMINFTVNYTRNTKLMVANQNLYSITYRGQDWLTINLVLGVQYCCGKAYTVLITSL